jgi:NifU-like protein involved in Fe-S cluster formation
MIDDVYNARILDFAGNIPLTGELENADAEASAHSKLCGSKVKVWLSMDGDRVSAFAHDVKACALGAGFILDHGAQHCRGKCSRIARGAQDHARMLKENGPAPEGRLRT